MSYALNKLNTVAVLDERVALKSARNFAVMKTGSTISYKQIPADGQDLTSINFNLDPPNPNTIVSRKVMVQFDFVLNFTGSSISSTGNLMDEYLGIDGAPRFSPLANITQVITANLNDTNVTLNTANVITAISRCNIKDSEYVMNMSTFPSMPDFYADYSNYVDFGGSMNVLGQIGTNGYYQPRGGWPMQVTLNNTTNATVLFSTVEPLWLSPFESIDDDVDGFHGLQTFKLQMVMIPNLSRVWSHNPSGNLTISGLTVTLQRKPVAYFTYISPGLLQNIPRSLVYNYNPLIDYRTTIGPVGAGITCAPTPSSLITFAAIPRRIYVFARKAVGTLTYSDTDTFLTVQNISIEYDNRQSLFAACTPQQLYSISQFNGLEMSWAQSWLQTGGIFICDVGRDLALVNDDEATGLSIAKQFQVTFTGTNLTLEDMASVELYTVVSLDGLMTMEDNRAILQTSVVSKQDILTAKNGQEYAQYVRPSNYFGGNFLKTLGKVGKTIAHGVIKYGPRAIKAAEHAATGNYLGAVGTLATGKGLVPEYVPLEKGGASIGGAMMMPQEMGRKIRSRRM
jgi:hypothetical protein